MFARTCLSLFGFLFCSWSATTACAHPRGPNAPYVISVEDEYGRELPTFHHAGQTFVLGRFRERYNLRVENHTGGRIEAVVTVDGRDVVSGSVGDFVGERGYLIEAHDQVLIEGFRRSWDEVAAFRFTSPHASYSARMGTPENVGVIGVAVFPERVHESVARPQPVAPSPAPSYPQSRARDKGSLGTTGPGSGRRESAAAALGDAYQRFAPSAEASAPPAPMAAAPAARKDNLGTEYGESVSSSVQEVAFERADRRHPAQVITLRYDDHEGLAARGIAVDPMPVRRPGPQAFPRNPRFAPPPPDMWD